MGLTFSSIDEMSAAQKEELVASLSCLAIGEGAERGAVGGGSRGAARYGAQQKLYAFADAAGDGFAARQCRRSSRSQHRRR